MTNHWIIDGGDGWASDSPRSMLRRSWFTLPRIPCFPYGHALALAKEIPGAQLLPLEQTGHEVPPRAVWNVVIPAILRHTSRG